MVNLNLKSTIRFLLMAAMAQAPLVPITAAAKKGDKAGSKCEVKKKCDSAISGARAQDQATGQMKNPGRMNGAANTLQAGAAANAQASCSAQGACEEAKKSCQPNKNGCTEEDCKAIEQAAAGAAAACTQAGGAGMDSGKTASATGGGGSGGNDAMMGMLMGAALGAGMAMMMNKKDDEEEQMPPPMTPGQLQALYPGALQPNGTIDCSKPDAYQFRDCNSYMEAKCRVNFDDPYCQLFSQRVCTAAGATPPPVNTAPPPPVNTGTPVNFAITNVAQQALGQPGEMNGSTYCRQLMAHNFCKVGGREQCPSCMMQARQQSPVCQQNPATCLAQNAAPDIERAKQTCPTDPAFADPAFAAGLGTGTNPVAGSGGPGVSPNRTPPAVVLPQSIGEGHVNNNGQGASGSTASHGGGGGNGSGGSGYHGSGGGGSGTGNTVVATSYEMQSAGGATREGYSNGGSQAGSGGGSGSGGGYGTQSAGGAHREVAGSHGPNYRMASTGPASDVQGQYAPSLFSTSSAVIRQRCQAGRLNNCP